MKRKLFSFFIVFFVLFNIFQPFNTYGNEGTDLFTSPNLVISRDYKMPVFKAGEEVRIGIPIENTTNSRAVDIFVSLVISDPKDFPFEIDTMVTRRKISFLYGKNKEEAAFYFKVKDNAEPKIYPITVNIDYKDGNNNGGGSTSDTIYVKVENDNKSSDLSLSNIKIDNGKLTAGKTKPVTFTIENTGDLIAKDIKVTLNGFGTNGLLLDTPVNTRTIKELEGGKSETITYNIKANEDMESGNQALDLVIKYKDQYDIEHTVETKAYIEVEGKDSAETDFAFEGLSYPKNTVKSFTDFKVDFNLKNIGKEEAKNVKISIKEDSGIVLPKSMSVKNLGNIPVGKSVPVEFIMFAKDEAETKNYPIEITVEYNGSGKESRSFSQFVGVFVEGKKDKDGKPKIIIDNYSFKSEFVKTGETFPLTLSFFNTHKGKAVKNIKVSLTSEGEVFSPDGGSNTFFIDSIPANGRISKTLNLKPKIDAPYKTHNITVNMEYEDSNGEGESITATETLGIPVIQETKLAVGEVETGGEHFVDSASSLSLEYYNSGRGLIRNLRVSIEGDFDTRDKSLFIGNVESGKSNYYDVTITPTKAGDINGKIIFEFNDEIDGEHRIEKDFVLTVAEPEMPPMPDPSEMMEEPSTGGSKKTIYIVGGGIIIGAIAGYVFYRRRKKKLEEVEAYE